MKGDDRDTESFFLRFKFTVIELSVVALQRAKRERKNGRLNNGQLKTRKESHR